MKPTIVIAEKEFEKGRDVFDACAEVACEPAPRDEAPLAAKIRETGARAVIVGVEKYVGPLYEALAGGLIARFGVGCDGVDKDLCAKHDIILANTPGVLDRSVAEQAIWLMGALARRIVEGDRNVRRGEFVLPGGEELCGKNLLLVGFGRIARLVAQIAGAGLGVNVTAFDILPLDRQAAASGVGKSDFIGRHALAAYTCDLERALSQADIVSIHMPANVETYHYFDAHRLSLCKDGAVLINTARGPIVDEVALYDALSSGRLSGAGIDVYETEPYTPIDPNKDLRTLSNVVLTPHIGSNTRQSNRRMAEASLANCLAFLAGDVQGLSRVVM